MRVLEMTKDDQIIHRLYLDDEADDMNAAILAAVEAGFTVQGADIDPATLWEDERLADIAWELASAPFDGAAEDAAADDDVEDAEVVDA